MRKIHLRRICLRTVLFVCAFATAAQVCCRGSFADTVNVRDYGAIGDGANNDTSAIQRALDGGASTVKIPAGAYSIDRTLLIGSNTTIQADPKAVIRLANGANAILLNNRAGATNVCVQGGVWDGNNAHNKRGADTDADPYCGCVLNFFDLSRLTIRDLTIRNPDAFGIRIGTVKKFTVKNISLDYTVARLNQDGVHINGNSSDGLISGIKAISPNTPNDDMVALNADDTVAMTEVLVRGQKNGPISHIKVENLRADNAYTFVRIYSNTSLLKDVTIRDIKGGFRYYAINISNHDFPLGNGDIRNVDIKDCEVKKTNADLLWAPAIDIGLKVRNLQFTNFIRKDTLKASTLVLRNNLKTTLQFADGSRQQVQNYRIPQGSIENLVLNPISKPKPKTK